jgi:hypothetical protein
LFLMQPMKVFEILTVILFFVILRRMPQSTKQH